MSYTSEQIADLIIEGQQLRDILNAPENFHRPKARATANYLEFILSQARATHSLEVSQLHSALMDAKTILNEKAPKLREPETHYILKLRGAGDEPEPGSVDHVASNMLVGDLMVFPDGTKLEKLV